MPHPANSIASLLPKLTDFGLAKLIDAADVHTRTGVLVGTPAYMAPEQVDASLGPIGPATDVYGLGTVLYELLTGMPAFAADNPADAIRRIAAAELTAPRDRRREVPRDLEAICLRAMQRRPQDRYPSAAALAADLRRFWRARRPKPGRSRRSVGVLTLARGGQPRRPLSWSPCWPALVTAGAAWHSVQLRPP